MSAPAAPASQSRLRSIPVIVAIAVLLGVGLAPIHPSCTAGTVIAVAGIALLVLARLLGEAVLTMAFFAAWTLTHTGRFWMNLAREAGRATGNAEQIQAELEAALQELDDDLRAKVREKIKNRDLTDQLDYVRALLRTMKRTEPSFKGLWNAMETAVASVAALAGVAFLLFWTFVYLLIWSLQSSAFSNLAARPRLGEFLFISASGALGGTPEGVRALSAWSQTAVTVELLSFVVLVGAFVQALRTNPTDPAT
jgi:hypothetical protein